MAKATLSEANQEIAMRLRVLRQTNNLSQADIGEIVGVSFQQIQKYENGSNRISLDKLMIIADTLKVPLSYFFEQLGAPNGHDERAALAILKAFCRDPMGLRMAQAFMQLPDKARRAAVELMEHVAPQQQPAE